MVYTLGEAAKATGKSKATISKAIKSGKISALKGETGAYQIDPAELGRVYPINVENEQNRTLVDTGTITNETQKIKELELLLEVANEKLADKAAQLDDLKEDRNRWRQQATALLEDQRPRKRWPWQK